jgi:hypothetical protein
MVLMTQFDMQQIVLDKLVDKLSDSVDLRERINVGFGMWFAQQLAAAAPPPAAEGGEAPPPDAAPAPEGAPA